MVRYLRSSQHASVPIATSGNTCGETLLPSTWNGRHPMLVPLIVLSVAIAMMACEAACPGRSWPQVSGWWLRAAILNCVQASMVFVFGHAWRDWLIQHRLWSAD